ncbi:hypothetical protein [Algoriphagus chordae]|uniref:Uncharacterized protein n=1 Tax=Algoriphagus chordae TaxID=237019 RepID=A0A2W7R8C5_9BACT|nr:hypothetical protein [Algoriphagus chordae]PZX56654.1 hypothetical protein LV85_00585 [Algoriphagus chordae]
MKKLLFGMAFLFGAMMFSSGDIQAGEEIPVEGEKWVCCLELREYCTDFLGGAWGDSTKKPGPFCP